MRQAASERPRGRPPSLPAKERAPSRAGSLFCLALPPGLREELDAAKVRDESRSLTDWCVRALRAAARRKRP